MAMTMEAHAAAHVAPPEAVRARPGRRFWAEAAACALVVVACLAALDVALRHAAVPRLVDETIDIQTPLQLQAKIERLARFQGTKVAILGDSVMLGHALREARDLKWRDHHLAALLQRRLNETAAGTPALVMNLALNGALPADLDAVAEKVLRAKPDLIILDISLRGFSSDFAVPGQEFSRAWLRSTPPGTSPTGLRRFLTRVQTQVDKHVEQRLARHWHVPATRDLACACFLDGSVRQYLGHLREQSGHAWEALTDETLDDLGGDELELVLKARGRFSSVQLAQTNPQWVALGTLLQRCKSAGQKTLLIYARENPDLRDQVLESKKYNELRAQLDSFIQTQLSSGIRYVPGVPTLEAEVYLDLVHVDAEGYQRMLTHLWPDIVALLGIEREGASR